ncbi:hypothetical protein CYMTET_4672 [Cymbomonas tetramitiformis]|uniref:Uncharacterized protein n=1 Tax=Cymbomonas tetramitiformis TaxID=36881 RepID=A0AAE0LJN3_9CHLO|nr:hypothetical protein CYMTET_4672 [Cymbomonas tetramitiformis]
MKFIYLYNRFFFPPQFFVFPRVTCGKPQMVTSPSIRALLSLLLVDATVGALNHTSSGGPSSTSGEVPHFLSPGNGPSENGNMDYIEDKDRGGRAFSEHTIAMKPQTLEGPNAAASLRVQMPAHNGTFKATRGDIEEALAGPRRRLLYNNRGSFKVQDGPQYDANDQTIPVYSCIEACQLVFGDPVFGAQCLHLPALPSQPSTSQPPSSPPPPSPPPTSLPSSSLSPSLLPSPPPPSPPPPPPIHHHQATTVSHPASSLLLPPLLSPPPPPSPAPPPPPPPPPSPPPPPPPPSVRWSVDFDGIDDFMLIPFTQQICSICMWVYINSTQHQNVHFLLDGRFYNVKYQDWPTDVTQFNTINREAYFSNSVAGQHWGALYVDGYTASIDWPSFPIDQWFHIYLEGASEAACLNDDLNLYARVTSGSQTDVNGAMKGRLAEVYAWSRHVPEREIVELARGYLCWPCYNFTMYTGLLFYYTLEDAEGHLVSDRRHPNDHLYWGQLFGDPWWVLDQPIWPGWHPFEVVPSPSHPVRIPAPHHRRRLPHHHRRARRSSTFTPASTTFPPPPPPPSPPPPSPPPPSTTTLSTTAAAASSSSPSSSSQIDLECGF